PTVFVDPVRVTDMSKMDKNEAKRTKSSTRMERAWENEAEGGYPIRGCDVHTIRGSKIDENEAVWIESPGLKMEERLKGLDPSPLHYK
ncbi:hypothetical protein Tco_1021071, partial [Tanacetum coccineum]